MGTALPVAETGASWENPGDSQTGPCDKEDMPEQLTHQPLFCGSLVTIADVRCRPAGCACGPEEQSTATTLAFPRAGVFVKHVRRQRIVATCNCVLFFNAGEPYRVSHPVPGGDDCTSLAFAPDVLADAVRCFDPVAADRPGSPLGATHGPAEPALTFFLHRLRQRLRAARGEGLALEELTIALLAAAIGGAYRVHGQRPVQERRASAGMQRERVEAAKAFVAGRFRAQLTLAEVSRAVHYSPYHLARLFRREAGVPIHRYQNRLRLGAALEQLADGADDLTALALDLGYSSHSHFSDVFRRTFGVPPSACRATLTQARLRELSKNLTAGSPGRG
jgi:AraC-like DNA-binding protein